MAALRSTPHLQLHPEKVARTSWKQYALRFVFGGVVTALVGVISALFGPTVAGLFLAFPAILPASLTLLASNENRKAAGLDAAGGMMGSLGLIAFALVVWGVSEGLAGAAMLAVAMVAWLAASVLVWLVAGAVLNRRANG